MLPGLTITTQDGGLGLVTSGGDKPLVVGTCSSGTAATLYTFSQPSAVTATLGQGPAATLACHILDVAGGSVDVMKTAGSTAATNTAVTETGPDGPNVTVAGTATDFFHVIVTMVLGGALGTARFTYSLDGGETTSAVRTTAGGGTFLMPGTGLTLTFAAGTHVVGTIHTFTSAPATYDATDLDAAVDALLLLNTRWKFAVFTGRDATASASATLAAGIGGYLDDLADDFRYLRGLVDCGGDSVSNTQTQFAAVEDLRLAAFFGNVRISVANPLEAWRRPFLPYLYSAAARVADLTRATNLGWVGRGKLDKVTAISFDEAKEGEQLHDVKINTTRTFVGRPGYYGVNGLLKSPVGSDFRYLHWGLAFDLLCQTVSDALHPYINSSLRVNTDGTGTIHPLDKAKIDAAVNARIKAAVLDPVTEQGFQGFFSAAQFAVDPAWNILTSESLKGDVFAVPLANTEQVAITAGLVTSLTSEESTEEAA